MRRFLGSLLVLFVFLLPRSGISASSTFNGQFFQPAIGRNSYLMLHSTDTLHALQFNVGDFISYGYRPLEMRQGSVRIRSIIDQIMVSDFVAAFSPIERLQLGLDLPLIVINKFQSPNNAVDQGYTNQFDIGDLRFEIKGRVLDPWKYYVGLAFVPFVTIPTGKDSHYVGDPGLTGGVKAVLDGRVHRMVLLTLNVGYKGGKKVEFRNVNFQHRLLLGGGASLVFDKSGVNIFGEVNSSVDMGNLFTDSATSPTEAMIGASWDVFNTGVSLQAGGGSCIVCGVMGAKARGVLAVKYRFNPPKYQQLDAEIKERYKSMFGKKITAMNFYELKMNCPDDPSLFEDGVHDSSCLKYYELREVADLVLRCPSNVAMYDPKVHDAACPKVFDLTDNFSPQEISSIYELSASEMNLRCPSDPIDFRHDVHDSACPKYYTLKEAVDLAEICPSNPADYQPGLHDGGCPKFYMTRGMYGQAQWDIIVKLSKTDAAIPGFLSGGEIRSIQPVYFAFNSSALTEQAERGILQVIKAINDTPWISRVMVAGHADSRGTKQANEFISKKRSEIVINYMRSHGLRAGVELIAIVHGAEKPAAPNETEEGRRLNRRVVFNVPQYRYRDYTPPSGDSLRPSAKVEPAEKPQAAPKPPSRWDN